MNVLRRLRNAGILFLVLWGVQIAWSSTGAVLIERMGVAALGGKGFSSDDGHALFRLIELVSLHPGIEAAVAGGTVVTAIVGWLGWTLTGGLVWGKLAGKSWIDASTSVLHTALPLFVQGLWHLLLMGAGLALLGIVLGPLPPMVMLIAMPIAAGGCVVAHDLVRGQICLHGVSRPFHPMTAVLGIVRAFSNPAWLATGAGLWLLQVLSAAGLNLLAIRALGPADPGAMIRVLAAGSLALGLIRIAIAIGWLPVALGQSSTSTNSDNAADTADSDDPPQEASGSHEAADSQDVEREDENSNARTSAPPADSANKTAEQPRTNPADA